MGMPGDRPYAGDVHARWKAEGMPSDLTMNEAVRLQVELLLEIAADVVFWADRVPDALTAAARTLSSYADLLDQDYFAPTRTTGTGR
jgi:hypothetical protein